MSFGSKDQDFINKHFEYDPATGTISYKHSASTKIKIGDVAGSINKGYRYLKVNGQNALAHRVAWFLYHGEYPPRQVDHINGRKDDNRIVNLRLATNQLNQANKPIQSNNTSGYKGVSLIKSSGKWRATIKVDGTVKNLGHYNTAEEAARVYDHNLKKFFGEYALTNGELICRS